MQRGELVRGLSPRVRGNLGGGLLELIRRGSIPARAGEPDDHAVPAGVAGVYPRACGGTRRNPPRWSRRWGLSPRVRGNHVRGAEGDTNPRSIPARAGEPSIRRSRDSTDTVYPRACGGTLSVDAERAPLTGLSPRVRGNRSRGAGQLAPGRSIPARAGEPMKATTSSRVTGVYPRACGGTPGAQNATVTRSGLSPRVRGNLVQEGQLGGRVGSIPARAGEPLPRPARRRYRPVYPRACGGTRWCFTTRRANTGLSPRVRGNPRYASARSPWVRSIPARAGEPNPDVNHRVGVGVYPRACGGTLASIPPVAGYVGLSPRVRGNLPRFGRQPVLGGSIPARAGEPDPVAVSVVHDKVYPRACGGTRAWCVDCGTKKGLSPRVRGNRPGHHVKSFAKRSIPARAGEPQFHAGYAFQRRVYPRACGGTAPMR